MNAKEPGYCPKCNSQSLDYGASEAYDESIGYPFTCGNCGHEDEEYYSLEFVSFKSEEEAKIKEVLKKRGSK